MKIELQILPDYEPGESLYMAYLREMVNREMVNNQEDMNLSKS